MNTPNYRGTPKMHYMIELVNDENNKFTFLETLNQWIIISNSVKRFGKFNNLLKEFPQYKYFFDKYKIQRDLNVCGPDSFKYGTYEPEKVFGYYKKFSVYERKFIQKKVFFGLCADKEVVQKINVADFYIFNDSNKIRIDSDNDEIIKFLEDFHYIYNKYSTIEG